MKLSVAGTTLAIFCLLYTAFAPAIAVRYSDCGRDWTRMKNHCYKFFSGPKPWSEAEGICVEQGRGAHLAMIKERYVQDAVDSIGRRNVNSREKYWIGAVGNKKESGAGNTYTWVDGSPLDLNNWGVGEPNNQGTNEHCVNNDHSKGRDGFVGKWNDDLCHKPLPFLCSYEI